MHKGVLGNALGQAGAGSAQAWCILISRWLEKGSALVSSQADHDVHVATAQARDLTL